ncbi:aminotransferase class III-fold pyridoxal phosphate-dependent enzyme, partial [Escherichia coli]
YWADALHALKGLPHVIDIRNLGLIGAIELEPIPGAPTKRAFQAFLDAYEKGVLIRTTGDIIALSPPLIITKGQIEHLFDT